MKKLSIIIFILLLPGCAGIVGLNYHALNNGDTDNFDCGAYMGEPRAGFIFNISGPTNNKIIAHNGNDILICSVSQSRESIYLVGPLIPVIPMFGIGGDKPPTDVMFSIYNRSDNKAVKFTLVDQFESCFKKQHTKCETIASKTSSIEIPSKSILDIKTRYKKEITLKLQLDDGENIILNFTDEKGIFFGITGENSNKSLNLTGADNAPSSYLKRYA